MNRKCWFALLVICLATFGQAASLGAVKFRCQQISEPNPNFNPKRINDKGQILGGITVPIVHYDDVHAAIWTPGSGAPQDLGTLGGNESVPYDFNEAGKVVGLSYTSSGAQHAFIWDQTQGIRDLGLLLGGNIAAAYSINNQGAAVGGSTNGDSPNLINRSVFWGPGGNIVDLGSTDSIPNAFINDYYMLAGSTSKLEGGVEPILLLPMGSPVSLGLLPGDGDCVVAKMNNKGHMVGHSFPLWQGTPKHGCLWS
jgi:probable HAF family extracellular repeat protein